jgi:hypothetical protein
MYECEICGNSYEIECIKEAEDSNDFGYRYCPFCGAMFDPSIIDNEPLTERR